MSTLADDMALVKEMVQDIWLKREDNMPMLWMTDEQDDVTVCMLAVGGGKEVADTARFLIAKDDPVRAVLAFEGWMPREDLPPDDPDLARVHDLSQRIADMPRRKREEVVMILGETRSDERAVAVLRVVAKGEEGKIVPVPCAAEGPGPMRPLFMATLIAKRTGLSLEQARQRCKLLAQESST